MIGKKLWMSLGVIAVVIGVGFFVYSVINNSPEMKLAKGFESLLDAERVQIDSDFEMDIAFDAELAQLGFTADDEALLEILEDLFKNIDGTGSFVYDKNEEAIEFDGSFGVTGDIQGEDINLQVPFRFYVDSVAEEMAIDVDPYVTFFPEFVDVFANNVIPHILEVEETLGSALDGQDVGEWFSTEVNGVIRPILEENLQNAKLVEEIEIDGNLFETREKNEEWVDKFILEKALLYMKDNTDGEYISEEDSWIYLQLDKDLFFQSFIHALHEVEANEQMKEAFEEDGETTVEEAIKELEQSLEEIEDYTMDFDLGFKVERGTLLESKVELTMSFEEGGISFDVGMSVDSTYNYDDAVEFKLYGQERTTLTEAELDDLTYEINWELESLVNDLLADFQEDYYEEELSEEDLALLAAIEAQELSHDDFGLTEEEMYYWVLDLELAGLVEPGTSDLYLE